MYKVSEVHKKYPLFIIFHQILQGNKTYLLNGNEYNMQLTPVPSLFVMFTHQSFGNPSTTLFYISDWSFLPKTEPRNLAPA